mmetsp:Transcript_34310/g.63646  ORF Transcript_34310/g.63646 Transcript_34310/m.63646 type:complete len:84 (-) Transcript_34310:157-408(-)
MESLRDVSRESRTTGVGRAPGLDDEEVERCSGNPTVPVPRGTPLSLETPGDSRNSNNLQRVSRHITPPTDLILGVTHGGGSYR